MDCVTCLYDWLCREAGQGPCEHWEETEMCIYPQDLQDASDVYYGEANEYWGELLF